MLRIGCLLIEEFMQMYFRGFSKKHFEAVHVLHVYSRAAESYPVEKATLNLLIDPIPAQVKIFGSSLHPDWVNAELQFKISNAC